MMIFDLNPSAMFWGSTSGVASWATVCHDTGTQYSSEDATGGGYIDTAEPTQGALAGDSTSTNTYTPQGWGAGIPLAVYLYEVVAYGSSGTSNLTLSLQSDYISTFASAVTHWSIGPVAKANITANTLFFVGVVPPGAKRFMRMGAVADTTAANAGTFYCGLIPLAALTANGRAVNFSPFA